MVQPELHPEDEGRQEHGDPGQPGPDQAPAGIPEALNAGTDAQAVEGEFGGYLTEGIEAFEPEHAEPAGLRPPGTEASAWNSLEDPVASGAAALYPAGTQAEDSGQAAPRPGRHLAVVVVDELVAWLKTLASAAVYATLIVTFGFQVARVEGQSMAPTLEDQDRLIVNKLAYRIGEPRRGDIVMLYYPVDPDKSFVKRVIAEEGDLIRIVDGQVYVNDVPLGDDFVAPEYRSHDEFGPTVVPEGYYFVMGDHRNNSSDSRHWGMVPKKYVIGKVQVRWWPIPTARVF
ncbi:MAG: signal peptidase I [Vicinamibacterales bacterium]